MSLPRNIDLTEHRDFGTRFVSDLILPINFDLLPPPNTQQSITCEEYERLVRWEGVFGRKGHKDQRNDIFDPEEKHKKFWEHTCYRCGKTIKIPWNNIMGVCKECDKDLAYDKVPWKKEETVSWGRESVFDLR